MWKLNLFILCLSQSWVDGFSSEGRGTLTHITFQRETDLACQWGEFPSFGKSWVFEGYDVWFGLIERRPGQRCRLRSGDGIALWGEEEKEEEGQRNGGHTFLLQPTMKRKKAREWSRGWYPLSLPLGCTSCSRFYILFISIFQAYFKLLIPEVWYFSSSPVGRTSRSRL